MDHSSIDDRDQNTNQLQQADEHMQIEHSERDYQVAVETPMNHDRGHFFSHADP